MYYSDQCPHTGMYAKVIADIAAARGFSTKLIKFEAKEQAQNAPAPFTTYSFFYNGEFITNEIFGEKKFTKFMDDKA